ncbi:putative G-protein coupled receptor Mth-like 1 [Anticarsia gemmatalis]|uniref:putative G-protein coupled receptor Mth-like 1 n=1 Tax=Anticarsia gemmatalis TaxID=129554 RepID=UPI003F759015
MKIILYIFILTSINQTCALSDANRCCSSKQMLIRTRNTCWDPTTNVTSPLAFKCNHTFMYSANSFIINSEDEISLVFGDDILVKIHTFCLGNKIRPDNRTAPVAIVCEDGEKEVYYTYDLTKLMIPSVIFLFLTALTYSAVPELRDVQGKCIINFCASLATAKLIIILTPLVADLKSCGAVAILAHYFFMAAMFWANATSVHVLLSLRRPTSPDYSWHAFKWYFSYAWGSATLLTTCVCIVNYLPGKHKKPGFGIQSCWFANITQQWYYMYSIMSILLAANCCIFIYIWLVLFRQPSSSGLSKALKYKFVMTVRLIFLMGLPWIFEILSANFRPHIIWFITDLSTSLQGVFIFLLLVVFRRRAIKYMYYRGWLKCVSGWVENILAVGDDEEQVVQPEDEPITLGDKAI